MTEGSHPPRPRQVLQLAGATLIASCAAAPCHANDATPGQEEDSVAAVRFAGVRFEFLLGAWAPRLRGQAGLGAAAPLIDLDQQLDLADSEAAINFELTAMKRDRFFARAAGFGFETESTNEFEGDAPFGSLQLRNAQLLRSSVEITSASLEIGIDRLPPAMNTIAEKGSGVDLRLIPVVGARWIEVEQSIERSGGGRESAYGQWVGLFAGAEFHMHFAPDDDTFIYPFCKGLHMTAGGGLGLTEGGFFWQVRAGLTLDFTDHLGVMLGYRLLELDLENGDYQFEAGLQGLFLAASVRF